AGRRREGGLFSIHVCSWVGIYDQSSGKSNPVSRLVCSKSLITMFIRPEHGLIYRGGAAVKWRHSGRSQNQTDQEYLRPAAHRSRSCSAWGAAPECAG